MTSEERDREVDAAWRGASVEEPPPRLDAAIRAEARRAVAAGPRDQRRHRQRQWRYPLAAAATVALLALGIVQLTPPEQVAPLIVSDQSAAPRSSPVEPQQSASIDTPGSKDARRKEALAEQRFAPPPAPAEQSVVETPSPAVAENADRAATAKLAQSPAASQTASPAARRDTSLPAPKPEQSAFAAPAAAGASGSAAAEPAASSERRSAAPEPSPTTISSLDELKAKQAGVESVEAWIARIRSLRSSGDLAAAEREIATFRGAFGDRADALLPRDLRGSAASDAKRP